jgi:hypothetical protein
MAGDWIKMELATPNKPETLSIAARLKITADEAFGRCFRAWAWAQANTTDGRIPGVTYAMLDWIVGLPGFAEAMAAAGWLVAEADGITIPNFERHMGQGAKARALAAGRMKGVRLSSQRNAGATRAQRGRNQRREE